MFVYTLDSSPIRSKLRDDDHIKYEVLKIKILELETKLKERKYLRIKRQTDITKPQSSSSGVSRGDKKSGEINNATLTYNESAESLGRAKGQRAKARLPLEPDAGWKGKLKESVYSNRNGGKPNFFELDEYQAPGDINRPPSDLPSSADEPIATGAIVDELLSQPQNDAGLESNSKIVISATEKSSSEPSSSISEALPPDKVRMVKKLVPRITSEPHGHSKLDVPNASSCEDTSSTTSLKGSSDSKSLDKPVPATPISAIPLTNVKDTVHLHEQETQGTPKKPVKSSRSWIRAGEANLGAERHVDREDVQPPGTHSDRGIHEEQAAGNDCENAMDTQSNWLERLGAKIKKMPNLPKALFSKKGDFDHAGLANEAKIRVSDTETALQIQIADRTAPILSEERDNFEQGPTAPLVIEPVGSMTGRTYSDYGSAHRFLEAWILHISTETDTIATSPLAVNNLELQKVIRKFQRKGRLVWQSLALLSSLQQEEINRLLLQKYEYDIPRGPLAWTLQALEIFPKRSKAAKIRSIKILIEARPCLRAHAFRQLRLYQRLDRERGKRIEQKRLMHPRSPPPVLHHIQSDHHGHPYGFDHHGHHGRQPQLHRDYHHSEDNIIANEDLGHDDRYGQDRINTQTVPIQRHRRRLSRHSLAAKSLSDDSSPIVAAMPRSALDIAQSIHRGRREDRLIERLRKRPTGEQETRPLPEELVEGQDSDKSQYRFRHRSSSDESQSPPGQAAQEPARRADDEPEVTIDHLLSKWTIFRNQK